eukprot:CAMPEP_0198272928 /NCGR_PEP_ID=MMETSP1447-20131203/55061_1 /TAXON_ID=420782 /ORGANISM="Chaetoceros dichaeta, Strain CCMP1751" /LENGTH=67 /DNA_ID=CAMNT_0043966377 /DNA_START=46 /DNA_END=245 /DNA_ORIENTATION=+
MASHPPGTTCPLSMGYSNTNAPRCSSNFDPTKIDVGPPAEEVIWEEEDDEVRSCSSAPPGIMRMCLA